MGKRRLYREVRAAMVIADVGRQEMADWIGISLGTMNNKLNGHTKFTLEEAVKICTYLGVGPEIFFDNEIA